MFSKYSEIENSYRNKFIEKFRKHCSIDKEQYVVMEKIHGSNFSICIDPDGNVTYRSRKRKLDPNENFYEFQKAISKISLSEIINFAEANMIHIQMFGELYGDGVQKGIDYSREKELRFFDIKFDDKYIDYDSFINITSAFNLPIVPIVMKNVSLNEALEFDVESFKSMVNPDATDDNIAEGVVIKPIDDIYFGHERFILKKKSDKFAEKKQKKPKKVKETDPIVNEWKPCVEQYVTESRMENLYSKEGPIEDPKQIGHYIKMYMEDLYEDFIKDYPEFKEIELSKKQKKEIMNVQKDIVTMLQKEL